MNVSEVAVNLEVSISQVHSYIRNKHLKSTIKNKTRYISHKDFEDFYQNYFLNRHKKKGKRAPNIEELQALDDFTKDINSPISYNDFLKKYKNVNLIIPPLDEFKLLKRNFMIIKDNEDMKQKDIAKKYNLSLRTIEEIIRKSKERSN